MSENNPRMSENNPRMSAPVATGSLLADATDRLSAAGVPSARHDAEALLAHIAGVHRALIAGMGPVDPSVAAAYLRVVARREGREPLQYILGVAGFRYADLHVGPGVFIPRPETELVAGAAVDELLRRRADGVAQPRALDLCTGSGAIAHALATEVPQARVVAVDVSPDALAYARRNLAGLGVDLRLGDIRTAVPDLVATEHVVVANPPYVPLSAYDEVDVEARQFDPPEALWSGVDGLDLIGVVESVAARALVDGGLVVCEHADLQSDEVVTLFAASGHWHGIRDHRDLAGRPRFVTGRRIARTGPEGGLAR
jgi:release factor glutamine methyltransferase